MRIPPDVPLHRGSVGAMGVARGSRMPAYVTKPYVYRGLGFDLFEFPPSSPKPKSKPKPKRRKARKRARPKPLDIQDVSTWGNWPKRPRPVPPEPTPPPPPPVPAMRPAPGWSPMTGADLDDLLNDD